MSLAWYVNNEHRELRLEELRERIFEKADEDFKGSQVDYGTTIAILISWIYYTVPYENTIISTMCNIDLSVPEAKERIIKAINCLPIIVTIFLLMKV